MAQLRAKVMQKHARADCITAQRQAITMQIQAARRDIACQEAWVKVRECCTPCGTCTTLANLHHHLAALVLVAPMLEMTKQPCMDKWARKVRSHYTLGARLTMTCCPAACDGNRRDDTGRQGASGVL